MRALIVDDEELARARLRTLLADCADPQVEVVGEAGHANQAVGCLRRIQADVVLLDIHMPGMGGLDLAQALRDLPDAPKVVFVTAHAHHALEAFDIEAVDYLTKPVRLERLQQALCKVQRHLKMLHATHAGSGGEVLLIREPGRTERVSPAEVLYFRAELKYVTVRTLRRSFLLEASLNDLELRHGAEFIRVHRSTLVARRAMRSLERQDAAVESESWVLRLAGVDEVLPVSRRQLAAVREAILSKTAQRLR